MMGVRERSIRAAINQKLNQMTDSENKYCRERGAHDIKVLIEELLIERMKYSGKIRPKSIQKEINRLEWRTKEKKECYGEMVRTNGKRKD